MSSPSLLGYMRPNEDDVDRRIFHSSWASASSPAGRIATASLVLHSSTTTAIWSDTESLSPSTSINSIAATSRGRPDFRCISTHFRVVWSIISKASGSTPAPSIASTAALAWSKLAKVAITVPRAGGFDIRRRVMSVMTPRVPSDPIKRRVKSNGFPPVASVWIISPVGITTSKPTTYSRVPPYLRHRGPLAPVATFPPIVDWRRLAGSGG